MTTLVGRSREIAAIGEALAVLAAGRGSLLLFAGEPGIGKSSLARYLAEQAREQRQRVYWGFSWESGGAPAYWPWTQALRSLLAERTPPDDLLRQLGQILPEAADESVESALQPDQARFRLLESTRQLLAAAGREEPFAIILEDLHAADADSLRLLQYIARQIVTLPLLLVGTYRELEARQSPVMEPLWRASRDARVMHPARLDRAAVQEFLAGRGAAAPRDERIADLLAITEGNPLFLTELVDLIAHSEDPIERLPETVQQVIGEQIAILPEDVAGLLAEASVLGREFDIAALARLRDTEEQTVERAIEAALACGLVKGAAPGRYRFVHGLHRDVLYQGLGAPLREELHRRCAQYVRALVDAGDDDRWTILATHLQAAGSDYRADAIEAWQKSAERARRRLAFDDAAVSMQNALAAFGAGPRFDPVERSELLLACGETRLLAGDLDGGRDNCREAFELARTLENTPLMAEAALTWGSALVVAHIDRDLIAALRDCLEALPDDDTATRSRVQARLAAALQPALDPSEPMAMAREAIELARTTGDRWVLYQALRSAIAALMDFAPPQERLPLNREFAALAAEFGDAAAQFRSNLRIMMDAVEIGDRGMMDDAIDACEQLANRIALPHYQWRVASARAMQCMIEGHFSRANALLDEAQALAEVIDDIEARITIPVQRFTLLCDWNSAEATPLAAIDADLQRAYRSGLGEAEFYVRPLITAFTEPRDTAKITTLLQNEAIVERAFRGGDRFSIALTGELAAQAGNTALAERAYKTLLPFGDGCVTLGLMGSCWYGPVTYALGIIARGIGRVDAAAEHFAAALEQATRMRSQVFVARVHARLAEIAAYKGNVTAKQDHRNRASQIGRSLGLRETPLAPAGDAAHAEPVATAKFSMRLDGDIRVVSHAGARASLKDSKGLQILARLLEQPDCELHVLDLVESPGGADTGDAGPLLDDTARAQYRERVLELQDALADAESLGDTGHSEALREELDFITRELSRAFGLGGRERPSGSAAERARVNVRRRLKDAIERIGEQLPDAGRYLENTIKTGMYCKYTPM